MLEGHVHEEIKFKIDRLDGMAGCAGTCAMTEELE